MRILGLQNKFLVAGISLVCLVIVSWLLVIFSSGCATSASSSSAVVYATAVLTHSGFDFTTGTTTNGADYDGETIGWNPDNPGTYITTIEGISYPNFDKYFWWRTESMGSVQYQQHLGAVALDTISAIPASWESGLIMPLLVGHSYVVKCTPEGYAKFYVTTVGTSGDVGWPVTVQYYFTKGSAFDK